MARNIAPSPVDRFPWKSWPVSTWVTYRDTLRGYLDGREPNKVEGARLAMAEFYISKEVTS